MTDLLLSSKADATNKHKNEAWFPLAWVYCFRHAGEVSPATEQAVHSCGRRAKPKFKVLYKQTINTQCCWCWVIIKWNGTPFVLVKIECFAIKTWLLYDKTECPTLENSTKCHICIKIGTIIVFCCLSLVLKSVFNILFWHVLLNYCWLYRTSISDVRTCFKTRVEWCVKCCNVSFLLLRYYRNSREHFLLQSPPSGRFQWKSTNKVVPQIMLFYFSKTNYASVIFSALILVSSKIFSFQCSYIFVDCKRFWQIADCA